MMDAMGIIITGGANTKLGDLTSMRAIDALPFGGRYRLIDFVLSSMVNSGIINVGVATQVNYSSLMDHLGSGAAWDLSRKSYGLFMLPPFVRSTASSLGGNVDILHGVRTYLENSKQRYVVLSEGNKICNMTFGDAIEQHKVTDADITVIYKNIGSVYDTRLCDSTVYEIASDNRVTGFEYCPNRPSTALAGLDMFIIERTKLIDMIDETYARGGHDFIRDIILTGMNKLKIYGWEYNGFIARVDSVKSYYDANMMMLDSGIRHELFAGDNTIYTKVKDQVPTRYHDGSRVSHSLIADGCDIEGTVENSIIFRGVKISKGATVKNCIIMQNTTVGVDCVLENEVIDKECTVRDGKMLVGSSDYPGILPKQATV